MVQVAGKYELVKSEGFVEMLTSRGISESDAKKFDEDKHLEIKIDGNKITSISTLRTSNYELGKEVEEKGGPNNETNKSLANLNGNVLNIDTTFSNGKTVRRGLTFSDAGVEVVLYSTDGSAKAKRIYKRV